MINLQVFLSRWHCAWSSGARTRAVVVSYTGKEGGSGDDPWDGTLGYLTPERSPSKRDDTH